MGAITRRVTETPRPFLAAVSGLDFLFRQRGVAVHVAGGAVVALLGFHLYSRSLSAALLQLRTGARIEQLLGSFGIALFTTI
jgi:hypothetical protein